MIFPPVDQYRMPFVEPIGHLTMQAAYAESELITLCATIPYDGSPHQMSPSDAARHLRNWNEATRMFVENRLLLVTDKHWQDQARDAFERYCALRVLRHRTVHDAIEVGIFGGHGDQPATVHALGVQYKYDKSATAVLLNRVTPEVVAQLACEMFEVQQDLNTITAAIRDLKTTAD